MSIFPAYSRNDDAGKGNQAAKESAPTSEWLENNSFAIDAIHLVSTQPAAESADDSVDTDRSSKSGFNDDSKVEVKRSKRRKSYKEKKKSREKRETKCQEISTTSPPLLDFTGNEEFYVDKNSAKQYCTVRTLHKPACPRYRVHLRALGRTNYTSVKLKPKRYYRYKKFPDDQESNETRCYPLTETEYTAQMGELNSKTMDNSREIKNWLDLIALQDRNPYKWSRLRVAEKKIDYVEKALNVLPFHPDLYAVYITTITQCFTSHDVSKMLEVLLAKDPHSSVLWQAQIMCTQGTMARCTVPDVLRIYERCMKKMFHNQKPSASSSTQVTDSDTIMMLLFHNCSLFLRQSGLYEQFFALIKLAVELNVSVNTQILEGLQPRAQDEHTLVEYEEIILQSGLPMNEIWLRIEKLRQGFFFLPFPGESNKCSDPQRIVFNEDVCHYVYPLQKRENSFKLLLIVIKLLKLPFILTHTLGTQFEGGDTDAIEDLLGIYTNPNYNWSQDHWEFFESLYDLAKEMASSPTYMNHYIAHDIYSECVGKFLTNCSHAYELIDERKRLVFLILWSRFQLLLLILEKLHKKLNLNFVKQGRQRFKALLKQRNNRACLPLYVEFARYEHEAGSSLETVENIFKNLIDAYNQEENLTSELAYVYLTYAEILFKIGDKERVCLLITAYVLGCDASATNDARKLAALNTLKEKVDRTIKIEENVEIMLLEQYLLPDHTLTQVKLYCLLLYTLQQKQNALEFMEKLLLIFNSKQNRRHQYLRENIYEIYVSLLQLPGGNSYVSHSCVRQSIQKALGDYPNNMFLLQKWGCQSSLPWYKLRSGYNTNTSIKSVIYLIALARCRFIHSLSGDAASIVPSHQLTATDLHYNETIVRQRILNLFKMLVHVDASSSSMQPLLTSLQRNSLFWRCYLRCLSDQSCSFELSKQCLLTALDECPWSKALYLDGATYVPQELSHLQDLIIEKQLRIYALPEELEILRER